MERTTLTLDDDVAGKLRERARQSGASYRDTVNQVLRSGSFYLEKAATPTPFVVKARPAGLKSGYSYDNIENFWTSWTGLIGFDDHRRRERIGQSESFS